jgi:Protein of unknown function (DUF3775)
LGAPGLHTEELACLTASVLRAVPCPIDSRLVDEQVDLVALAWLGREDYTADDWASVREEAARAHNDRTASYLLDMPLLDDFLDEGLSTLGYSREGYEINRL